VKTTVCMPAYLQHLFNERDNAWRARHARELDRVQVEHAQMLHMLHVEVERLQAMLRGRCFFNSCTHITTVASIDAYNDMYGEKTASASCNHADKDRQVAYSMGGDHV